MFESELRDRFKSIVVSKGWRILREFYNAPPDLIIEKQGRTISMELKVGADHSTLAKALGQLLFSKFVHKTDEIWLVIPEKSTQLRKWIKILEEQGVRVFQFCDSLEQITPDSLPEEPPKPPPSKPLRKSTYERSLEIDKEILQLLERYPQGLTFWEIALALGIYETVKVHVLGPFGMMISKWQLRDLVVVEGNKAKLKKKIKSI